MALSAKEADIQMMLSAEVHLGTKNCDFQMERYVFKRRNDDVFVLLLIEAVRGDNLCWKKGVGLGYKRGTWGNG
ncbi:40S ribosomal protein SA [Artemisia annua]|uniref:40S ribosomal protein SA n=1 Tax=Artemisia annua TaxID=35608 RepID=A0A2U1M933_ARTAN|nr:40S ribosomal protein SA [Artemisia annua]